MIPSLPRGMVSPYRLVVIDQIHVFRRVRRHPLALRGRTQQPCRCQSPHQGRGADVNARGQWDFTPLHCAAQSGDPPSLPPWLRPVLTWMLGIGVVPPPCTTHPPHRRHAPARGRADAEARDKYGSVPSLCWDEATLPDRSRGFPQSPLPSALPTPMSDRFDGPAPTGSGRVHLHDC